MISEKWAKIFCSEPIELIENYDKAIADKTQTWHCHHIWETMLGYSKEELIEMNEYYGIPACNLIFLTPAEHHRIHSIGNMNPFYGKHHTEETRRKIGDSTIERFGLSENNPMYGKHHTEEARRKMSLKAIERGKDPEYRRRQSEANKGKTNTSNSRPVLQYSINGDFIKEFPSTAEAERITGYRQQSIARCARGERKYLYNFIWKYKN